MGEQWYRFNPEWVSYYRRTNQELVAEINDEFGVHGEGVDSMVPLVLVEVDYMAGGQVLLDNPNASAFEVVNAALGIEGGDDDSPVA